MGTPYPAKPKIIIIFGVRLEYYTPYPTSISIAFLFFCLELIAGKRKGSKLPELGSKTSRTSLTRLLLNLQNPTSSASVTASIAMDPFTVIGIVCNVWALFDHARTCVKIIRDIYNASSGMKKDDESLASSAVTLETIAGKLQTAKDDIGRSWPDLQMKEVASQCSTVCTAIQTVLNKCKPKKEKSIPSATGAMFRGLFYKSEVEKLQQDLDKAYAKLTLVVSSKTLYVR